jgi:tetratricopeptide (TPR) repeat protein
MRSSFALFGIVLLLSVFALAQQDSSNDQNSGSGQPPRSDQPSDDQNSTRNAGAGASSRETRIDISPPANDVKDHPLSPGAVADNDKEKDKGDPDAAPDGGDVREMKPFNPYRANNDVEVGDYYFKMKNYKGALARYQDALVYKDNNAIANFRMAQCYEKLNQPHEAVSHYREYLKILPNGQYSKDARKALQKLGASDIPSNDKPPKS